MSCHADKKYSLSIENLNVKFGGSHVLENINVKIEKDKITALIGPNGAGKTTLLSAILGLVPYTGKITFYDQNGNELKSPKIGYVPQRLDFDRESPITVLDFLALTELSIPIWLSPKSKLKKRAMDVLASMNAQHLINRPLGKLSGGEFQRVILASALKDSPDIILLDEPVSGMDVAGEEMFCELLAKFQQKSRFTLLLVSHDLSVVTIHADNVICLNKTVSCCGNTVDMLSPENLSAIYGVHIGLHNHPHNHHCNKKG